MISTMANVSYTEPSQIRVGDTLSWRKSIAGYPASDWTLTYTLINSTGKITITGTADGVEHVISVASTVTDEYVAGWYDYTAHVSDGADRISIGYGRIQVLPNLAAATTYDNRSHARKMLDAIESALESSATKSQLDLLTSEFQDRKISRDKEKLLVLRDRYKAEVSAEDRAESVRRGLGTNRRIQTRLA